VTAEERMRQQARGDSGVSVAPPGYEWVNRGPGVWQLAPIVVFIPDRPR
jgi:hypothetical protein